MASDRPPHHHGPRAGSGGGAHVWLARHAQVHERWSGVAYGSQDVPLSEAGLARSEELGASLARLAPSRVVSSDLERAAHLGRGTAQRAGVAIELAPELREIHRGAWEELTVADLRRDRAGELEAFYADPWTFCDHGGEADRDVVARAWPRFSAACEAARGGVVVLTAHYNVLRCLVTAALGLDPRKSFAWRLDTARAALLVDEPGGFVLAASNVADPGGWEWVDEHLGSGR